MIIISHPTGNQNSRNAAEAFYKADQLARFYTTIAWNSQSSLAKLLPAGMAATLKRREYSNIPAELIATQASLETCRLLANKLKLNFLTKHETGLLSVDAVYRAFDNYVAKQLPMQQDVNQIYAYEDGALETFKVAKQQNIQTLYELPIGYWRAAKKILGEEAELNPAWANTIISTRDSSEKLNRKDRELRLADKIIVPSQFVADTLKLFEDDISRKVHIVPYGGASAVASINTSINKKLKVLFVGGLSQRKGLSYLFDAIELLKGNVSLTVIGTKVTNDCSKLNQELLKHRYTAGLSHREVLEEMYKHDVLVFPSLFEGFALVILEAMSQGIPVITTPNAGAGETIVDGKNGYLVPIRSHEVIAEKIQSLANNRDLLHEMKLAALEQAKKSSWELYQKALVQNVLD